MKKNLLKGLLFIFTTFTLLGCKNNVISYSSSKESVSTQQTESSSSIDESSNYSSSQEENIDSSSSTIDTSESADLGWF